MGHALISEQENITAWFKRGASAYQAKEWDAAAECYTSILSLEPADADSLHFLGLARAEQWQPLEALKLLNQAVQLQPHHPMFYCNRALLSQRQRQWQAAIVGLSIRHFAYSSACGNVLALGETYALAGRRSDAILPYLYAYYLEPQTVQ